MKKLMMSAVCAMMAAATFAESKVEITEAYQQTPGSGIVNYSYTISGLRGIADLFIKVGAKGCDKTVVLTNLNVTAGTVTTSVDVKALLGKAYPNVTLFAELEDAVQLWENGPYFAKANVGASKPEEYGYCFWWGDTVGYTNTVGMAGGSGSWVSVKDGTTTINFYTMDTVSNQTMGKDISALKSGGWIDDCGNLVVSDDAAKNRDAARAHLGAPWRMMTDAELQNLTNTTYCTRTWVYSYKGKSVQGYVVKGAKDPYKNNEVFFPAAGYGSNSNFLKTGEKGFYWPSAPDSGTTTSAPNQAWSLQFDSSSFSRKVYGRCYGMSVRPVR